MKILKSSVEFQNELAKLLPNQHRVFIFGNGGSGKSTMARLLAKKFNVDCIELDLLQWEPGWVFKKPEEIDFLLTKELQKTGWVIEFANLRRAIEVSKQADLTIWLDPPTFGCIKRVLLRSIKRQFKPTVIGREKLSGIFGLVKWCWQYSSTRKPLFLDAVSVQENVIVLKDWNIIKEIIDGLK